MKGNGPVAPWRLVNAAVLLHLRSWSRHTSQDHCCFRGAVRCSCSGLVTSWLGDMIILRSQNQQFTVTAVPVGAKGYLRPQRKFGLPYESSFTDAIAVKESKQNVNSTNIDNHVLKDLISTVY